MGVGLPVGGEQVRTALSPSMTEAATGTRSNSSLRSVQIIWNKSINPFLPITLDHLSHFLGSLESGEGLADLGNTKNNSILQTHYPLQVIVDPKGCAEKC